ncbi:hypothetical protein SASPL_132860 [Salvia splendens]|uniref:Uncharacterized protein n=1 Tax=Salvia splendens TaxID=180675 RepID=A0A8X8X401_SALSN|nr:hypothetical protein SASPL_132860 [Salvia splendens]
MKNSTTTPEREAAEQPESGEFMELRPRLGEKEANFSAELQIRLFRRREAAEESEAEEGGGEGEISGGFGVEFVRDSIALFTNFRLKFDDA